MRSSRLANLTFVEQRHLPGRRVVDVEDPVAVAGQDERDVAGQHAVADVEQGRLAVGHDLDETGVRVAQGAAGELPHDPQLVLGAPPRGPELELLASAPRGRAQ